MASTHIIVCTEDIFIHELMILYGEMDGEIMYYDVVVGIYEKIGNGDNCCDKRIDSHLLCGGFETEDEAMEYVNNYDDSCHYGGIEIYEAQKAVIQSAVKNMDKNKTTLVIGEMGVGKYFAVLN